MPITKLASNNYNLIEGKKGALDLDNFVFVCSGQEMLAEQYSMVPIPERLDSRSEKLMNNHFKVYIENIEAYRILKMNNRNRRIFIYGNDIHLKVY